MCVSLYDCAHVCCLMDLVLLFADLVKELKKARLCSHINSLSVDFQKSDNQVLSLKSR